MNILSEIKNELVNLIEIYRARKLNQQRREKGVYMNCHTKLHRGILAERSTKRGIVAAAVGIVGGVLIYSGKIQGDPITELGILATIVLGILGVAKKEK
jgi:hypothetical protein